MSPDYYIEAMALMAQRLVDDGQLAASQTIIEATYHLTKEG